VTRAIESETAFQLDDHLESECSSGLETGEAADKRGPSSSSTTTIAYGGSNAGRRLGA